MEPAVRERLDAFVEQVKKGLERGNSLHQMRGVKATPGEEGVWEASVFSPAKGRVLFRITGSQGEQTIEIVDYK